MLWRELAEGLAEANDDEGFFGVGEDETPGGGDEYDLAGECREDDAQEGRREREGDGETGGEGERLERENRETDAGEPIMLAESDQGLTVDEAGGHNDHLGNQQAPDDTPHSETEGEEYPRDSGAADTGPSGDPTVLHHADAASENAHPISVRHSVEGLADQHRHADHRGEIGRINKPEVQHFLHLDYQRDGENEHQQCTQTTGHETVLFHLLILALSSEVGDHRPKCATDGTRERHRMRGKTVADTHRGIVRRTAILIHEDGTSLTGHHRRY